jgi:methionyl-tRNA formyltransferase
MTLYNIHDVRKIGASFDIILVMREEEANFFCELLLKCRPALIIGNCPSTKILLEYCDHMSPLTRLIAFSTFVIIPGHIIEKLQGNCYNFHPGPPEYPGYDPIGLCLYDGVCEYGITLHQITEEIDSGDIVGYIKFPIKENCTRLDLTMDAYKEAAGMVRQAAKYLADIEHLLLPDGTKWGMRRSNKDSMQEYYILSNEMDETEIMRRQNAFAEKVIDKRSNVASHE